MKEQKIIKFKTGELEIEFSPMAYYTEQTVEQTPLTEEKEHPTDEDLLFWSAPREGVDNEMV